MLFEKFYPVIVKRVPPLMLPTIGVTEETVKAYLKTFEPEVAAIESPVVFSRLTLTMKVPSLPPGRPAFI